MLSRLFGRPPCQKVVAFHVGRSGSSVLAELLGRHPEIHWVGEIYERHFRRVEKRTGRVYTPDPAVDPARLLRGQLRRSRGHTFGFELKFFHLDLLEWSLEGYLELLQREGFARWILLERRNLLRKVVSSLLAHPHRDFTRKVGSAPRAKRTEIDVGKVSIDRGQVPLRVLLEGYVRSMERLSELLDGCDPLRLVYEEDLLPDPQRGYARTCRYLGHEPVPAETSLARVNPFPLRELIANFDAVEAELRGTAFEWMLYDDPPRAQ